MIVAADVQGSIENFGLEELGVRSDHGSIAAEDCDRTSVPGVYAIGDVAGPPMLAHKAEHEGVACVEVIYGVATRRLNAQRIPGCTYGWPQIASVGLTEAQAKAAGYGIRIGRFPFAGDGKATSRGS